MYREIQDFAPNIQNDYSADPLYYCTLDYMDSQFLHGAQGRKFGRYNSHCSEFMAARCASNWDQVCEAMSKDTETRFPDMAASLTLYPKQRTNLTYGEQLLRDSAYKKYKVKSLDCNLQCEPFDPTVPNSPLVCYEMKTACSWGDGTGVCFGNVEAGLCQSIFKITPEQAKVLDQDPIMNKLLQKPDIAPELFEEIYNAMKADKSLYLLRGTRLGVYYTFLGHPI